MLCFRQVSPLGKSDDLTGIFFNLWYLQYNHLRRRAAHVALAKFRSDGFDRHARPTHIDVDAHTLMNRIAVAPHITRDAAGQLTAGRLRDANQIASAVGRWCGL